MSSKKQKLELTWIGQENRSRLGPRIRIEFADDPSREDSPVGCHEAALFENCIYIDPLTV
jgi:hypothetical protein